MTHFIRDNTSPGSDKTTFKTSAVPDAQKLTAAQYNVVLQSLRDIQSYVRAGLFDASPTVTVADMDLVASASPSIGPELDWGGNRGRWFIGVDVANADTSRDFVLVGQRGTYSFSDGVTTSGSPTLTSAARGGFASAIIGAAISGAGIPVGATVLAVGGPTSLTMSANATASASSVAVTITANTAYDIIYVKHRGGLSPTIGIGVTPPDGQARLQVSGSDSEPAMGAIRLRRGPSQTANVLTIHDSGPTDKLWVDKDYYISGTHGLGGAICVQADTASTGRAVMITGNDKTNVYSFDMPTGSGGVMRLRCTSGGFSCFDVGTDGSLRHLSSKLGFYGASTIAKPAITGSRGGNAALASLLTQLATLGLITDSTTA